MEVLCPCISVATLSSDIELSFYSYERGVRVKNCGISLVYLPLGVGDHVPDQFPAGLHVLAVDDDPTSLVILEKMLRAFLYEVLKCNRLEAAFSLFRGNRNGYDIVICDIHMPHLGGFKFPKRIRLKIDLPLILMSADDRLNVVVKDAAHSACDYPMKPIRMEELKNIWQHVVQKRKEEPKDEEGDRQQKLQSEDVDYSSSANEGRWKNLKRRKEEDEETKERSDYTFTLKKRHARWSVELHGQFVAAVNQLGIDMATPKKIMELVNVPGLTMEDVAGHLLNYRFQLRKINKMRIDSYD